MFGGKQDLLRRIQVAQAHDRMRLLEAYRREIANLLVWRDPDGFLNLYRALHSELSTYKSWKPEALRRRIAELCERYPNYEDFDAFGTRSYILYQNGAPWMTDEELAEQFSNIARFQELHAVTEREWGHFIVTSDNELEHLTGYILSIKDTKFKIRLMQAVRDYYHWRHARDSQMHDTYDAQDMSVQYVPHFAENRYGIHLKTTQEFGLYSFFMHDDGHATYSWYRSDPTFETEQLIDPLREICDGYSSLLGWRSV